MACSVADVRFGSVVFVIYGLMRYAVLLSIFLVDDRATDLGRSDYRLLSVLCGLKGKLCVKRVV